MKDFVDALDPLNAIADESPGFVWRHKAEKQEAATIQFYDNIRVIVNLSVWKSMEHLKLFLRTMHHTSIMRRPSEWFQKMPLAYVVLWWIPVGRQPTPEEALRRLDYLRENGPTDFAFDFANPYPQPE